MIQYSNPNDHIEVIENAILQAMESLRLLTKIKVELTWLLENASAANAEVTHEQLRKYEAEYSSYAAEHIKEENQLDFLKSCRRDAPTHADPALHRESETRGSELRRLFGSGTVESHFVDLKHYMRRLNCGVEWNALPLGEWLSDFGADDDDPKTEQWLIQIIPQCISCVESAMKLAEEEKKELLTLTSTDEAPDTSNWPTQADVVRTTKTDKAKVSRGVGATGGLVERNGKIDPISVFKWVENGMPVRDSKPGAPNDNGVAGYHCAGCKKFYTKRPVRCGDCGDSKFEEAKRWP